MKQVLLLVFILINTISFCQYDIETVKNDSIELKKSTKLVKNLKKNTYVGSGLNLALGNQLYLYATPQIGYEFLSNFSAGFLSLFQYYQSKNQSQTYTQSALGGGIFTRYILFEKIIVESSFNLYKIKANLSGQAYSYENMAKSWMIGLGLAYPLGEKSYSNVLISYDLLNSSKNPENTIINLDNFKLYFKFGVIIYPFSN